MKEMERDAVVPGIVGSQAASRPPDGGEATLAASAAPSADDDPPHERGDEAWLPISDASRIFQVSRQVLFDRVKRGSLESKRVLRNGRLVVSVSCAELEQHYVRRDPATGTSSASRSDEHEVDERPQGSRAWRNELEELERERDALAVQREEALEEVEGLRAELGMRVAELVQERDEARAAWLEARAEAERLNGALATVERQARAEEERALMVSRELGQSERERLFLLSPHQRAWRVTPWAIAIVLAGLAAFYWSDSNNLQRDMSSLRTSISALHTRIESAEDAALTQTKLLGVAVERAGRIAERARSEAIGERAVALAGLSERFDRLGRTEPAGPEEWVEAVEALQTLLELLGGRSGGNL